MLIRTTSAWREGRRGGGCGVGGAGVVPVADRLAPRAQHSALHPSPLTHTPPPAAHGRRIEKCWKLAPDSTEGIERVEVTPPIQCACSVRSQHAVSTQSACMQCMCDSVEGSSGWRWCGSRSVFRGGALAADPARRIPPSAPTRSSDCRAASRGSGSRGAAPPRCPISTPRLSCGSRARTGCSAV